MEVFQCSLHLHLFVFAVLFTSGCIAQNLVGPDPQNQAFLNGTTHTFQCRLSEGGSVGTISWVEILPGSSNVIYFGETKSNNEKYVNFNLDTDGTSQWDLVINDVEIEDGGTYDCGNDQPAESHRVVATVEVEIASLKMMKGGIEVSEIEVVQDVASDIVCEAKGARPLVDIAWFQIKDNIQVPIDIIPVQTNVSTDGGDTFDTTSTLSYIVTDKDYNGGSIKCSTSGQDVAPAKTAQASLAVLYPPEITYLEYGDSKVVCRTDANPPVTEYVIILNNTDVRRDTQCSGNECEYGLEISYDTDIRCNATNDIGTDTKEILGEPGAVIPSTSASTTEPTNTGPTPAPVSGLSTGAIVGIVIGVLVLIIIIILLLVYFLVIKKKKDKNKPTNSGIPMKSSNGSGDKPKERPTPAPRNSQGDAKPYHDNDAAKKPPANDNPDGITYAALEHGNSRPASTNKIIRTEEPTEYADVKTFIRPDSPP